jgi:hypothetical protein
MQKKNEKAETRKAEWSFKSSLLRLIKERFLPGMSGFKMIKDLQIVL